MGNIRKPNISRDTFSKMIEAGDQMASFIYTILQRNFPLDALTVEVISEWQRKWDSASRRALAEDNK